MAACNKCRQDHDMLQFLKTASAAPLVCKQQSQQVGDVSSTHQMVQFLLQVSVQKALIPFSSTPEYVVLTSKFFRHLRQGCQLGMLNPRAPTQLLQQHAQVACTTSSPHTCQNKHYLYRLLHLRSCVCENSSIWTVLIRGRQESSKVSNWRSNTKPCPCMNAAQQGHNSSFIPQIAYNCLQSHLVAAPCMYRGCLNSCAVPHSSRTFVLLCGHESQSQAAMPSQPHLLLSLDSPPTMPSNDWVGRWYLKFFGQLHNLVQVGICFLLNVP